MNQDDGIRLVGALMALILIGPAAWALNRGHRLPMIAAWIAIAVVVALLYEWFGR